MSGSELNGGRLATMIPDTENPEEVPTENGLTDGADLTDDEQVRLIEETDEPDDPTISQPEQDRGPVAVEPEADTA